MHTVEAKWFVAVLFVYWLVYGNQLIGQDASREFVANEVWGQVRWLTFVMELDGSLQVRQYADSQQPVLAEEFFVHPLIISELRISADSAHSIKQVVDDYRSRIKNISIEWRAAHPETRVPPSDPAGDSVGQASRETDRATRLKIECFEKICEIVGESKSDRLSQLLAQFLIYRQGLSEVLSKANVGGVIQIGEADLRKIRERQFRIANDLRNSEISIVESALQMLLDGFDDEQVNVFYRYWGNDLKGPGGLGRLWWSLSYGDSGPHANDEPNNGSFLELNRPVFVHGADGNVDTAPKETWTTTYSSKVQRFYGLQHFLGSEFVEDFVDLANEQWFDIAKLNLEFAELKTDTSIEVAAELGIPIREIVHGVSPDGSERDIVMFDFPADRSQFDKQMADRLEEHAGTFYERLVAILLPHQKDMLTKVMRQLEIRSRGPLADITYGALGVRMGLNDTEKTRVNAKAKEVASFIEEETRRLRDRAVESLLSELDTRDRDDIALLMGNAISTGFCDIRNLAFALSKDISK